MNKRIQELAEQCYQIEDPHGQFPREVFDKEKFARLIVRECAQIANQCIDDEWFDVGGAILEHFKL